MVCLICLNIQNKVSQVISIIDYYTSSATFSDEELINMIRYAKSKSIRVALKPTVNCKNGVWRAYISFFEKDVPCEPK